MAIERLAWTGGAEAIDIAQVGNLRSDSEHGAFSRGGQPTPAEVAFAGDLRRVSPMRAGTADYDRIVIPVVGASSCVPFR